MTDGSALVLVSPYGPFIDLALTVHELAGNGRFAEAIAAADEFQAIARAFGDEKTVDFLIQGRMFAHQYHGDFAGAMAVGLGLLDRQRAAGNVLGEAKTLADLAQLGVQSNRTAQSILHLARAGLLLETTSRRNERRSSCRCGSTAWPAARGPRTWPSASRTAPSATTRAPAASCSPPGTGAASAAGPTTS
jgi:hypothetical protein